MECEMTYQEVFFKQFIQMLGNFAALTISVGVGYPLLNFYKTRMKTKEENEYSSDTETEKE